MMWWFDSNKTKQNKKPSSKFFANLGLNIEGIKIFDTSFRSNVFNPIWRHCLSDDCSPCSYSALRQHSPSPLTGTVYPRHSRLTLLFTQVFALKVTLENLFYTVSLKYPQASLLFPLYLHLCVCVCVRVCKLLSRV